jgi:hypothetical protein
MFEQPADRCLLEGDIVVTAVAHHFSIGRVQADGKHQEALASELVCSEALNRARLIAGPTHRVFMYWDPGTDDYRLVPVTPDQAVGVLR